MTNSTASIEALVCEMSKHVDGVVVLFKSQNDGANWRYSAFEALGDTVANELSEEDIAYAVYPHNGSNGNMGEILEKIADDIASTQLIGLSAAIYQNGQSNGVNLFGTDAVEHMGYLG